MTNQDVNNQISISEEKDGFWDRIGFHKTLGGWYYNFTFFLVNMFTGIFITGWMLSYFYPFPESTGYLSTVDGVFSLFFFTFDIGTAYVMERFIPEARIKNPLRMLQYIRYFVWYQSFTGLIQITAVAYYCFNYATQTDLVYLVWVMLIISAKQYPGMLGVFYGALNSFQHYNKAKLVSFTQGEVIQRLTELLFVWMGKQYGIAHPEIGMLLGIALGATIGKYIDDFFGMALAAYFFSQTMQKEGITMLDCFIPSFPMESFLF